MLEAWKRPGEIHEDMETIFPREDCKLDLTQDVITDCSVVASLCSAIQREEKGFGKVSNYMLTRWYLLREHLWIPDGIEILIILTRADYFKHPISTKYGRHSNN
jgi:hypothetical protein